MSQENVEMEQSLFRKGKLNGKDKSMKKIKKKNMLKKMLNLVTLALCAMLFWGCQMETHAYTEEEIEAAKAWLSANGYSPDAGGASQAYQDYLNGKFDAQVPGQQTPGDTTTPNGTTTPNDTSAPNDTTTPNGTTNPNDTTPEQTPNEDTTDENGTSGSKGGESDGKSDSKKNNGSSKGDKGDKEEDGENSKSENSETGSENGNGTGTEANDTENESNDIVSQTNPSATTGSGQQTGELTTQEEELLLQALEQFVMENTGYVSTGSSQTSSMSENEISENNVNDDNWEAQTEKEDEFVAVSSDTNDREQKENKNAFYIWIIASIAAVALFGVICFFVLRKK